MFPSAGMKRRSAFDLEALGFFLESAPYFLYFFACLTALELSTSSCWGAGARVLDAYVRYLGRDTYIYRAFWQHVHLLSALINKMQGYAYLSLFSSPISRFSVQIVNGRRYVVASAVMSCPWDLACDPFPTSVLLSIWIAAWDDAVLQNQYASLVCDSHVWSYFELAAVSRGTGMPQGSFSPLSLASLRCCRGSKCPQNHLRWGPSPK